MAEEKKTAEVAKTSVKEKKAPAKADSKGGKFVNGLKNFPKRIAASFKNMYHELKRVTWPTKHKLMVYSVAVIVFVVAVAVVIGLLDMGASALVRALVGLKGA